jgi:hypothetical protein
MKGPPAGAFHFSGGFFCDNLFKRFTPRLLCLGHSWKARIMTGCGARQAPRKSSAEKIHNA